MSVVSLIRATAERIRQGPDRATVFSSRVRLARNFRDIPFPNRATAQQRPEVVHRVVQAAKAMRQPQAIVVVPLGSLSDLEREALVENHIISRDLAQYAGERAIAYAPDGRLTAMVNEEDHVRIQALAGGLDLEQPLEAVGLFERALAQVAELAQHDELGYLTACPTNVGTGLRASVLLRLPALFFTKRLRSALGKHLDSTMAVRGMYGEGSQPGGFLLQISNQRTADNSPQTAIELVLRAARGIGQAELAARSSLLRRHRAEVQDLVWRAAAILRSARMMTSEEALERLAHVRMGLEMKLLEGVSPDEVDGLMLYVRPATFQLLNGATYASRERDIRRAEFLAQRLEALRAA